MPDVAPAGSRPVRRLLVVGGSGFVGGNVARLASKTWDVAVAGRRPRADAWPIAGLTADIADWGETLAAFGKARPDAVVNAAAVSGIDFAERNRELAWKVNVVGARNVAEACSLSGAKCVFFSSDAVFSGSAGIYREGDEPDPVNFYGKTKAEAESSVLSLSAGAVVIRISLVLGYPAGYRSESTAGPLPEGGHITGGNAFYPVLEESLRKGASVAQPADEIRTPVDVITLAEAALELAAGGFCGIIHIGSTGSASRYEIARLAARAMGYPPGLVTPKTPASCQGQTTGRAPRHKNGIIDVSLAGRVLKTRMLGVEESVRRSVVERL
jgi:dTDP-4-dehydrorhamnose reductase